MYGTKYHEYMMYVHFIFSTPVRRASNPCCAVRCWHSFTVSVPRIQSATMAETGAPWRSATAKKRRALWDPVYVAEKRNMGPAVLGEREEALAAFGNETKQREAEAWARAPVREKIKILGGRVAARVRCQRNGEAKPGAAKIAEMGVCGTLSLRAW